MFLMPILDDLRNAVRNDERTQTAIAEAASIHPKTFSAFMHARRGLSIETIEKLADALDAELKLMSKPRRLPKASR